MKTLIVKEKDIEKKWVILDAKGKILGRLASKVATLLMGKHKTYYSPHQDCGDFVIVLNAKDIKVTGKKQDEKMYRHYSGYPGGLKEHNFKYVMAKKPEDIIQHAVKRMLPNNNLRRRMMKHLKVYAGSAHGHKAQKPVEMTI